MIVFKLEQFHSSGIILLRFFFSLSRPKFLLIKAKGRPTSVLIKRSPPNDDSVNYISTPSTIHIVFVFLRSVSPPITLTPLDRF